MATSENHSIRAFLTEYEEDASKSEDTTEITQVPLCNCTNGNKTQPKNCEMYHEKNAGTANKGIEIEQAENSLRIRISGFSVVQTGSNCKLLQVQSYKCCDKHQCYSTSDEENYSNTPGSTTKIQAIEAGSYSTHVDSAFKLQGKCFRQVIATPMRVIPKRGCLNSPRYILLIFELKDLRDRGDFEGHEQMIQLHLRKRSTGDVDMEVSLQIERAMALYFQNNVKEAKKVLKLVLALEQQLKNPGILTGRALTLLTAVYKHQGKFGNAMKCLQKANRALEYQDSRDDKAELYHSYGALLNSLPAGKITQDSRIAKEEAYKSYEIACQNTSNNGFRDYVNVKMAAMLLNSCSIAVNSDTFRCKEDVMKAKKHLDFVEFGAAGDNMVLGTKIKHLLFRSDQYRFERNVTLAMEKAKEARVLIHRHGFELERVSADKRISHLSEMLRQEDEEWENEEPCLGNDYLADSERSESESAHLE